MTAPADTTRALRTELEGCLRGLLEPGTRVALVNFPNIANPGDSAIYAGTLAILERIGVEVAVACEPAAYRRRIVTSAVGERGTVLLQGGGNMGDLYRSQPQQTARHRVLRDLPRARVIQLPQSIYFASPERSGRFVNVCRRHEDLTIMVRDRLSGERAAKLGLDTVLAPDMALGLGPLARPAAPVRSLTRLLRGDQESADPAVTGNGEVLDWPSAAAQRAGAGGLGLRADLIRVRWLNALRERAPVRARLAVARAAAASYARIADRRLRGALALASSGEVLVTDRLHGHLLACLMEVPNVVLDNSYGKNRAFWEAWSHRYDCARFAVDPAEAAALARELAAA